MNIFVLDKDPNIAAQMLCNKHMLKLLLEHFQMLSTAHRVLDDISENSVLYKATHKNHPCNIWCRTTNSNYNWLYQYTKALSEEYTFRYGKIHNSWCKLGELLKSPPTNILEGPLTPFAMAMPKEFQNEKDVVKSYQSYYKFKRTVVDMKWKNRNEPLFLNS